MTNINPDKTVYLLICMYTYHITLYSSPALLCGNLFYEVDVLHLFGRINVLVLQYLMLLQNNMTDCEQRHWSLELCQFCPSQPGYQPLHHHSTVMAHVWAFCVYKAFDLFCSSHAVNQHKGYQMIGQNVISSVQRSQNVTLEMVQQNRIRQQCHHQSNLAFAMTLTFACTRTSAKKKSLPQDRALPRCKVNGPRYFQAPWLFKLKFNGCFFSFACIVKSVIVCSTTDQSTLTSSIKVSMLACDRSTNTVLCGQHTTCKT